MTEEKSSYRQIMKATSLYGGVQVFTILIGIVRSKFVAILLGTSGMGILGLYQTTLSLIQSITGLGLSSSAVRDISEANGSKDNNKIANAIKTLRRWVWATGLLGATITISFAPLLSKWTFGNEDYTWAFVWLSVILLLNAISSGQTVLLQGMRHLKQMAKSTLFGSILGLCTSIPLYYFLGLQGIIPALIITAISSLLLSHHFAKQIPFLPAQQTWKETYHSGFGMAKLGFVMMLSNFMVMAVSYIVNLFISNKGGVSEVGLYRAGWTITNQYTGLIFTSMATDYYPRLAAINSDNEKLNRAINQQAEIAILILAPLLVALIGLVPLVVHLFYTSQFMPITGMIKWTMLGMLFKAASWALAFSIVAKGDNRLFFVTETVGNALLLLLNLVGYQYFGLNGIGISFTAGYILYFILILIMVKRKYGINYHLKTLQLFTIQFVFICCTFIICAYLDGNIKYILSGLSLIIITFFSLKQLNKRIDIRAIAKRYYKK
jgi:O-antigen/teichoic acid export membrane protein